MAATPPTSTSTSSPAPGRLRLLGPDGAELESSDATFEVQAGALLAHPSQQPPLRVDLADVDAFEPGDYVFALKLATGETVEASMLGRRFGEVSEAAAAALTAFRAKNLLLEEPSGGEAFACDVERQESAEEEGAQVRVYATSLAVLPRASVPYSLPFGELASVAFDEDRYALDLTTASGKVSLLRMGKKTQPCLRLLEERLTELRKRTAEALAFLVPTLPTLAARRFAQAMQDGVPAQKSALDAISPTLWADLSKAAVGEPALRESIAALAARCPEGEVAVGIKETNFRQDSAEGEAGEPEVPEEKAPEPRAKEDPDGPMAKRVVWFAFPVYGEDRTTPGNAVAIEAATRAGRATYLFRIAPAEVYRQASWEELQGLARDRIRSVSRALVALGFKREPIYLPDEVIRAGPYARYRLALRLSAPLKATRAAFLGRAIHHQGWSAQVDEALAKAIVAG
ncbi:MAG TPA: hypothetical protein VGK67_26300 [Myxococcales bacterium]|jgi:hypothetical protein